MTDFAPNFTNRIRVRYAVSGMIHVMTSRYGGVTPADPGSTVISAINAFLSAIAPTLSADWTVVGADAAQSESDVFLPVAGIVTPTGKNEGSIVGSQRAAYISFVGKDHNANLCKLYIFGTTSQPNPTGPTSDFRLYAGEATYVAAGVSALNGVPSAFNTIEGLSPVWYPYANLGYNAYYQRKLRG